MKQGRQAQFLAVQHAGADPGICSKKIAPRGAMGTKKCLIAVASSFGLMILGSITGSLLESSGYVTRESLGHRGRLIVQPAFLALLFIICFAALPLFICLFIVMQIKIGNGELFLVKFFKENERAFVCSIWVFYALGLAIIFTLGKDDILASLQ